MKKIFIVLVVALFGLGGLATVQNASSKPIMMVEEENPCRNKLTDVYNYILDQALCPDNVTWRMDCVYMYKKCCNTTLIGICPPPPA